MICARKSWEEWLCALASVVLLLRRSSIPMLILLFFLHTAVLLLHAMLAPLFPHLLHFLPPHISFSTYPLVVNDLSDGGEAAFVFASGEKNDTATLNQAPL